VRTFETVEELRQALLAFRETYNTSWLIERHGFQTPAAVPELPSLARRKGLISLAFFCEAGSVTGYARG
jgi:hypothetical protein